MVKVLTINREFLERREMIDYIQGILGIIWKEKS
jgi:hypothetical protein